MERRNEHSEFVGLSALKQRHAEQLAEFEKWALNGDWRQFHDSHYDWWMFPIDQPSRLGFAYTVLSGEIEELKRDDRFMKDLVRGAELLLLAWGWDLYAQRETSDPDPDQCWQDWPIRLFKCLQSLTLFKCLTESESVKTYGLLLIGKGKDFTFRGRDLSYLFLK